MAKYGVNEAMGDLSHDWAVSVWEDEGKRWDSEDKIWDHWTLEFLCKLTSSRASRKIGLGCEQKGGSKV